MGKIPGVMLYAEIWEALQELKDREIVRMLGAMMEYSQNGTEPQFEEHYMRAQWKLIRSRLDRNAEQYEARCQQRREAANKRWEKAEKSAPKRSGYNMTRQEMDGGMDKYLDW